MIERSVLPSTFRTNPVRRILILAVSFLVLASSAHAQRVSLGAVAGGYANKDFVSHYIPTPGFNPNIAVSDAGGFIFGPTIEIPVNRRFSFAVDEHYKTLHYKQSASFYPDGSVGYAPATVVTWQFPLLARYRVPAGPASIFLEGGPSLRTAGNLNTTNPSHRGLSIGLGVERVWHRTAFAPSARYTRWAKDLYPWSHDVQTRSDQLEFMIRFTWGLGK